MIFPDRPKLTSNNKFIYHWTAGEETIITQTYISNPAPTMEVWYKQLPSGELKPLDSLNYTTISTPAIVLDVNHGKHVHAYGFISTLSIKDVSSVDHTIYMFIVENKQGNLFSIVHLTQNDQSKSHLVLSKLFEEFT